MSYSALAMSASSSTVVGVSSRKHHLALFQCQFTRLPHWLREIPQEDWSEVGERCSWKGVKLTSQSMSSSGWAISASRSTVAGVSIRTQPQVGRGILKGLRRWGATRRRWMKAANSVSSARQYTMFSSSTICTGPPDLSGHLTAVHATILTCLAKLSLPLQSCTCVQ